MISKPQWFLPAADISLQQAIHLVTSCSVILISLITVFVLPLVQMEDNCCKMH
jgi:hypothetical protein